MEKSPYSDDMAQASEYLRLAIALLSKHQIPPSPYNFRIGYDVVAGRNEGLKAALEELTGTTGPETDAELWDLYKRTFIQDDKALDTMRHELHRIITTVKGEFEQSGSNLSVYRNTLNDFAELLTNEPASRNLADAVSQVITKTRVTEESQRNLSTQLNYLESEVQSLRNELENVRQESLTDALTGISNRKAFDASLEQAVNSARDSDTPFCIILVDIDHFKKVNDTHGNLVGDKVLRFVASTIKRSVKGKDLVARYGGEEFALILPHTDITGAHAVAEQVRQTISAGYLKDKANQESYGRVTVSIGVAEFLKNDMPSTLLQKADRALYLAKERGRNRVEKAA